MATEGEEVIGFVAAHTPVRVGGERNGGLMCLLVAPSRQRQGIGRALQDQALNAMKQHGVVEAQLGAGGLSYFWPGVPTNLPGALAFFRACDWPDIGPIYDLVGDLAGYVTPAGIYERIRLPNVVITTAEPADLPAVLAFESHHFPRWLPYYQSLADGDACSDIVLAREDASGRILGVSSVLDAQTDGEAFPVTVWQERLGENLGGVGPLGVAEDVRENGIGLALAAHVTELLRDRGRATSFVGYTWLVDWYGKLGYRVWQEYRMSRRPLN